MADPGWLVAGASVSGRAHEWQRDVCQDAHAYRVLASGQLVIAAADGAGSAICAAQGAQLAAQTAVVLAEAALVREPPQSQEGWWRLAQGVFCEVHASLQAAAHERGLPIQALATTLTLVLAADPWLAVAQIGDGVVVLRDLQGAFSVAVLPERGEHANETAFLLSREQALGVSCWAAQPETAGVCVLTDGLLRLALYLPACQPFGPFFQPLFELLAETADPNRLGDDLAAWLGSEMVCARTDDDKTLVVAVRAPAPQTDSV